MVTVEAPPSTGMFTELNTLPLIDMPYCTPFGAETRELSWMVLPTSVAVAEV